MYLRTLSGSEKKAPVFFVSFVCRSRCTCITYDFASLDAVNKHTILY